MHVEALKQCIVSTYPTRQPLMIWGAPGVGKSSGVYQASQTLKIDFIDLRLALLESIDLRGCLIVVKDQAKWTKPPSLPSKGNGILFLDEIVQAVPSMQAAASQLILDRRIGEYQLPDGWHVVAAGNRAGDRAATSMMPSHIANRFVHLNVEPSLDIWVQWALRSGIDIRVVAFLKWRSALLHAFDPQSKSVAFPTPRSWEAVSKILSTNAPTPTMHELIRGAVGDGAGAEFCGFLQVFDKMTDPDAILLNPKTAAIPDDPASRYAVVTALSARATKDNLHRIVTYCNRFTDEANAPDYCIAAIRNITAKEPGLATTKAFIEWASKHNHLLV